MAGGGELKAAVRAIAEDSAQAGEDIGGKWGQFIDDTAGKVLDSVTTAQDTEEAITQRINSIRPDPKDAGLPDGAGSGAGSADGSARGLGGAAPSGKVAKALSGPADDVAPPRVDSRGRPIPDGVQRLPSGKLPSNFSYAGKVYDGEKWTPELAAKYPDGVKFTQDGFPDFGPYARSTQVFPDGFAGNRSTDFVKANEMAGLDGTPDDYIWHHHQDGKTMQLVPEDMHEAVRHAGGVAIVKGRVK